MKCGTWANKKQHFKSLTTNCETSLKWNTETLNINEQHSVQFIFYSINHVVVIDLFWKERWCSELWLVHLPPPPFLFSFLSVWLLSLTSRMHTHYQIALLVVSYKLQTQRFGTGLKTSPVFHALRIFTLWGSVFSALPAIGYTTRWGRNRAGELKRAYRIRAVTHFELVEKQAVPGKQSAGVFPNHWEFFRLHSRVSDAGSQFMVWMSGSGSLMREYEVDNRANSNSRSSAAAEKQSRVQPRATESQTCWLLFQTKASTTG